MSTETLRGRLFENGWTSERWLVVGGAFLVVAPFLLPSFQVYLLTEALIVALFAIAFNLLYGYTGLLSFGHAMFYAAAAYGLGIFLADVAPDLAGTFGALDPLAFLLLGGAFGLAAVVALAVPVGYLSVRLEEIYFALITLSFSMAFYALMNQNVGGLTRGSDGLNVFLGTVEIAGASIWLADRTIFYFLVLAVVTPAVYALWRVVNSPFGMVCRAVRESPDRARAVGIDVRHHRWVTFVVSAFFAGVAGVLIAPLHGVVAPELGHWTVSAVPVIAAVVGGASVFFGPAVGAAFYIYLRWGISRYPTLEAYWELTFGLVLLVVILYFKQGIAGGLLGLRSRIDGTADDGEAER
ncbi:branched-chain amino acid ABC transporter permease [Haloferacaceae archaeon DSL9]